MILTDKSSSPKYSRVVSCFVSLYNIEINMELAEEEICGKGNRK